MLTIIIGIILAIILFMGHKLSLLYEKYGLCIFFEFVFVILVIAVLCILTFPVEGYSEVVVKEIELVSFSNEDNVYLLDKDGKYTYKYISGKNEEKGNIYTTKTVKSNISKIEEYENCEKPLVTIYEKNANRGLWTFAFFVLPEKKYVFELPKNSIQYTNSIVKEKSENNQDVYIPYVMP